MGPEVRYVETEVTKSDSLVDKIIFIYIIYYIYIHISMGDLGSRVAASADKMKTVNYMMEFKKLLQNKEDGERILK